MQKSKKFYHKEIFHGYIHEFLCISTIDDCFKFWSGSPEPTRLAPKRRCFFGQDSVIWHPTVRFTVLFVSLPLWGAMLQATVEFCKQNVEGTTLVAMFAWQTCKFVLQNTNLQVRIAKYELCGFEVLEIYTAQTAITSSVTRISSCHLPHRGRLLGFFASHTGEPLRRVGSPS